MATLSLHYVNKAKSHINVISMSLTNSSWLAGQLAWGGEGGYLRTMLLGARHSVQG